MSREVDCKAVCGGIYLVMQSSRKVTIQVRRVARARDLEDSEVVHAQRGAAREQERCFAQRVPLSYVGSGFLVCC